MRKALLFVLLLPFFSLRAQNTAPDLTLTDCNGNQHSLYTELEQGRIIVLQIVDPKAPATLNALRNIEGMISQYKSANPDKVYSYAVCADATATCDDMPVSLSSVASNYIQFPGSSMLTDYFKVTAYPAVMVLGNGNHRVYGNFQGYSSSKDVVIKASIEESLAESNDAGGTAIIKNSLGTVFPNPFTSSLNVRLNPAAPTTRVSVCDLTGKSLLTKDFNSEKLINFNTSSLQKGIYFLNFYQGDKITGTLKLVKRQ